MTRGDRLIAAQGSTQADAMERPAGRVRPAPATHLALTKGRLHMRRGVKAAFVAKRLATFSGRHGRCSARCDERPKAWYRRRAPWGRSCDVVRGVRRRRGMLSGEPGVHVFQFLVWRGEEPASQRLSGWILGRSAQNARQERRRQGLHVLGSRPRRGSTCGVGPSGVAPIDASVDSGSQRSVWAALRAIPAGETRSYGALAAEIERPAAVRAVGLANGANPVGVVVPCHRVIGANASLTGYAGGIERKRWLLSHEGVSRPKR